MRVQRNATGALLNMTHSGALPAGKEMLGNVELTQRPLQMRTGSSWLMPAPSLCLSSSCHPPMLMCSTTARPR
jgi:hypothetical protein